MDIQIATLCDAAADYHGKLSILGSFDTIAGPEFPVFQNQCALALRICFLPEDEGEHKFSIKIIDADGGLLVDPIEPVLPIKMPPGEPGFMTRNLILNMHRLKFDKPGFYYIDIGVDGEMQVRVPLRVLQVQMPPGAVPPGAEAGPEDSAPPA